MEISHLISDNDVALYAVQAKSYFISEILVSYVMICLQ